MKIIFAIMLMIMLVSCSKQQLLGASCGTVSPDSQDECCANKMKDTTHLMCEGAWGYFPDKNKCEWICYVEKQITNFVECAAAGNPIMESYPRQCTANGQTFVEVINEPIEEPQIIGGQRDEHGCLGPAGYSWNQEIGACARAWELTEDKIGIAKMAVQKTGQEYGLTIDEVEILRCPGCYIVKMSNAEYEQFTVEIMDWKVK